MGWHKRALQRAWALQPAQNKPLESVLRSPSAAAYSRSEDIHPEPVNPTSNFVVKTRVLGCLGSGSVGTGRPLTEEGNSTGRPVEE
ncbi:hypothetical protein L484_025241 [Morus notabilis]|uniref:Uncharacterized protein n=1 Tax=Morus notabilis TaxID=981085 RepID=W9RUE4_9ROSA|nr:hypothetical protein L484_025241 [Morus notabilis]